MIEEYNLPNYFPKRPEPTPEEKEEMDRQIENDFWEAMTEHNIDIDGETKSVYTETNPDGGDFTIAFSDGNKENAKLFVLSSIVTKDKSDEFETLLGRLRLETMSEEDMVMLYKTHQNIATRVDSQPDPNKVPVSEMSTYVNIKGEKLFLYYIPKGSGAFGRDALKERKREVGTKSAVATL